MLNDRSIIMTKTESKERILQTTFYLLLAKGYNGVSISDIQHATGMSRGLLYHYYGSKEELFRVAGETFLKDLLLFDPTATAKFGFWEMINHIVMRYKELYKKWNSDPDSGSANITMANYDYLVYQMIEKEPRIAAVYREMRRKESEAWTQAATSSLEKGEIRTTLNASQIARHMTALLDGIWMQVAESGDADQHVRETKQILTDYYELVRTR